MTPVRDQRVWPLAPGLVDQPSNNAARFDRQLNLTQLHTVKRPVCLHPGKVTESQALQSTKQGDSSELHEEMMYMTTLTCFGTLSFYSLMFNVSLSLC